MNKTRSANISLEIKTWCQQPQSQGNNAKGVGWFGNDTYHPFLEAMRYVPNPTSLKQDPKKISVNLYDDDLENEMVALLPKARADQCPQ